MAKPIPSDYVNQQEYEAATKQTQQIETAAEAQPGVKTGIPPVTTIPEISDRVLFPRSGPIKIFRPEKPKTPVPFGTAPHVAAQRPGGLGGFLGSLGEQIAELHARRDEFSTFPEPVKATDPLPGSVPVLMADTQITKSEGGSAVNELNLSGLSDVVLQQLTVPAKKDFPIDLSGAKFDKVSFPIWTRQSLDDEIISVENGGLKGKTMIVGTYQLVFDVPKGFGFPALSIGSSIPFTIDGKKAELQAMQYDPNTGELRMQVLIKQNLIMVLSLVAAALAAGGYALSSLNGTLKEVRYTIKDSWILAAGIVSVLAAWYFFIRKKAS